MKRKPIIVANDAVNDSETTGNLPPGWTSSRLGDLTTRSEYGTSTKCDYSGRSMPVLRIPNIARGEIDTSDLKRAIADMPLGEGDELQPGDMLICRTNGSLSLLGKAAVIRNAFESPHSFASYLLRFRFLERDVLPRWIHLFLSSAGRRFIERRAASSAGQHNISLSTLNSMPLPLAPPNEQRRIVEKIEELFSDLEAGVAALTRARANLKRYRASVLKAAVEGSLTAEWRARQAHSPRGGEGRGEGFEPASQLLDRILTERRRQWEADQLTKFTAAGKQPPKNWQAKYAEPERADLTDVPPIPEGWTICSLDQLTTTITSGSRDWSQYYGDGTGTFIMAQNVRPGKLDLAYRQPVNPPADDRDRARSQVVEGDLLVTIVGANTGDVCRVDGHYPEHYVCQSVALMRPVLSLMSPFVEAYFVSHENGQRQFRRYIYGQGRPHLGFDQLRVTPILLPPLAEQKEIVTEVAEKLSQIEAAEVAIDHSLRRAARLRQSILKQAFEGKLVPQDPTDEPASRLLARICDGRKDHDNPTDGTPSATRRGKFGRNKR